VSQATANIMPPASVTAGEPAAPAGDGAVSQAGERRSARIESLRALAALAVVWDHAFTYTFAFSLAAGHSANTLDKLMGGGHFAVFLFFALTGYLLFWPFAKAHFGDAEAINLGRYVANRALRILPLYFAVVVVVLTLQEHGSTPGTWARFLTFSESFSTQTVGQIVAPLWSLVVELHFYLLLPLLAWALGRVSRGSMKSAAALLLAAGAIGIALRYREFLLPSQPSRIWQYSLPVTFWFFVPGMLLALLRLSWERRRPGWLRGAVAGADLWLLAAVPLWAVAVLHPRLDPLIGIAAFLVVGGCVLPLRHGPLVRALGWRPLALLGVASYSLYLWHAPVLRALIRATTFTHSFPRLMLIAVPVMIAVALASYALIESPFLRLRRQWARSSARQAESILVPKRAVRAQE
jgi:peptidoglycan/LPS O-acetylase OafA/YrhL